MADPGWALQTALHAALVTDGALTGLLGGPRVYDHVPRGRAYPYVTFSQSVVRDWSTGTDDGQEHVVTLHVWSRAAGRQEAQAILSAIREALHDTSLPLTGHRLVNLRHEFSEVRREPDGETFRGLVCFRAATEPTG